MRKKILWIMLAALTLTACGNAEDSETKSEKNENTQISDNTADKDGSSNAETDIDIDSLNETIGSYGTVKLCDYKALELERPVYKVTEEDIDDEVENLLIDYTDYKKVDRASKEGDYLNLSLTASDGDEVIYDFSGSEEDSYDLCLGNEDFGSKADKKLTGVKKGDELSFSVSYDEDFDDTNLAGRNVKFEIKVNTIEEEIVPELTETFIKDSLGYSSKDDMRKQLKEALELSNNSLSDENLRENAAAFIVDNSQFSDYSDELFELYAQGYDESYSSYLEWFDYETLDELYEAFGISDEIREEEILNLVYRKIAVDAIAKAENLTVSLEDFNDTLEAYTTSLEYETSDELLADYGEYSIYNWALEGKVFDLVLKTAKVKDVEVTNESEE